MMQKKNKKKIKIQKYLKIRNNTKNLKIPNSLPLLNLKNFGKMSSLHLKGV